jgi:hypothetical protein
MASITAITAITNKICTMPVAEYINTPKAHPISNITAIIYNNEFMINLFISDFHRYNYNIARR